MIIDKNKIPNGWTFSKLSDVCQVITGTTPSRTKPEYFGYGIPWVTPGDFKDFIYISNGRESITELGVKEGKGKIFPPKTVLLVCIGATIGKIAVSKNKISANQQINALICKANLYPEFLYFYLKYNKHYLISIASSSTVPIINQERLGNQEILLPPLPEQKRIAAILEKCDRLRRTRRYSLQLSETFLQSVFLEMFGNLITNQMGWFIKNLDDVADIASGVTKGQKFNGKQKTCPQYIQKNGRTVN